MTVLAVVGLYLAGVVATAYNAGKKSSQTTTPPKNPLSPV